MADISKVKTPDGSEYNLKDSTARSGLSGKQDTLVSGTNIKTINNTSLLGSGNIDISGGGGGDEASAISRVGSGTTGSLNTTAKVIPMSSTTFNEGDGFTVDSQRTTI